MISFEVRNSYPMIALGRPGDKLGAGRLPSSDTEWKALVLFLMEKSKVIFMVPSKSEGVLWEMECLKRYNEKTIYIMPPLKYHHSGANRAEGQWSETRQELLDHGISLPSYSPEGALFMLDGQGKITRSSMFEAPWGGTRVGRLVRQIA